MPVFRSKSGLMGRSYSDYRGWRESAGGTASPGSRVRLGTAGTNKRKAAHTVRVRFFLGSSFTALVALRLVSELHETPKRMA